jgi:metal-sulfur cluster biosynthetic enzyme
MLLKIKPRAALAGMTTDVKINWVWMPPWGPDKISDDGRDQLRARLHRLIMSMHAAWMTHRSMTADPSVKEQSLSQVPLKESFHLRAPTEPTSSSI